LEILKLLKEKDANVFAVCGSGINAFSLAKNTKNTELTKWLYNIAIKPINLNRDIR